MTHRNVYRTLLASCAALLGALLLAHAARASVDSPTYGYGNARTASAPGGVGINWKLAQHLHTAWVAHFSGAIDGQPLVVNGVKFGHRRHNIVLVGTEHGYVSALDVSSGHVIWTRRFGTRGISPDCMASPDGTFGITGTMVADPTAGRVYAVDAIGRAWALHLNDGRTVKGWPVFVHKPGDDFDWGALALSHGWLYVPIASLCDRGTYYGGIHEVNVAHPRIRRRWGSEAGTGLYGGGIWGWGGESINNKSGDVFAATGNALPLSNETGGSAERVVKLSPTLKLLQRNYPLTPPFAFSDRDFGTAPVLIRRRGCPLQAIAINKDGWLYRYDAEHIAGGAKQFIKVADISATGIPLYGMPAYDPASHRLILTSPAPGPNGRREGIQTYIFTRRCKLITSWQHGFDSPSAGSAPTIAEGVLYIGSGRNGILRIYRLGDGRELDSQTLGPTIFAAPIVADGTIFAADWGGNLSAFRP